MLLFLLVKQVACRCVGQANEQVCFAFVFAFLFAFDFNFYFTFVFVSVCKQVAVTSLGLLPCSLLLSVVSLSCSLSLPLFITPLLSLSLLFSLT